MQQRGKTNSEAGFSLMELMVSLMVMLIIGGAAFSLMRSSMRVSITSFELTDAQESVRIAQEYINRDLLNAGDGLNSLSNIKVTSAFVSNYLSKNPGLDVSHLGILTSDNDCPAGVAVPQTTPAVTVRSSPLLTDRISILARDTNFTTITPVSIDATGANITLRAGDEVNFAVGEVYFLTSSAGSTFCTVRAINGAGTSTPTLNFASGDVFGLNVPGVSGVGLIRTIADGGATAIQRMQIIQYYVNSNGLLVRRVFGVKGSGFTEATIAEHITSLQFRYILKTTDASGNVVQPVAQMSSTQQTDARQVEVTVTAETAHSIGAQPTANGNANVNGNANANANSNTNSLGKQTVTMTGSTSVRNMQFKQALQPR